MASINQYSTTSPGALSMGSYIAGVQAVFSEAYLRDGIGELLAMV